MTLKQNKFIFRMQILLLVCFFGLDGMEHQKQKMTNLVIGMIFDSLSSGSKGLGGDFFLYVLHFEPYPMNHPTSEQSMVDIFSQIDSSILLF
jgi:hypothetical protein